MNKLEYWVRLAELDGDEVFAHGHDWTVLTQPPEQPRKPNSVAHMTVLTILFFAGFVTFFLTWLLIVPYLIGWAVVVNRANKPRLPQMYRLVIGSDGGPLTSPPDRGWQLRVRAKRVARR